MKNEALAEYIKNTFSEHNNYFTQADVEQICAALRASAAPQGGQKGDDKTCYYCGKNISIFASNPHEGCPVPLMHRDEPGKIKWHHIGCVMDRLIENQPSSPAAGHAEGGDGSRSQLRRIAAMKGEPPPTFASPDSVVVPREPTQAMIDAATHDYDTDDVQAAGIYRAMLAAAPKGDKHG